MKKVNKKVIKMLIDVYTAEIGAVGIYMDQHTKCADRGYKKLAEMLKNDAVEEMKHAEKLAERILFLGGEVAYQKHSVPDVKQTEIIPMIKQNIDIEVEAIERLNAGIATCFSEGDNGSRILLDGILQDEEKHLDELQIIHDNIKKYGDQYVVTHLM